MLNAPAFNVNICSSWVWKQIILFCFLLAVAPLISILLYFIDTVIKYTIKSDAKVFYSFCECGEHYKWHIVASCMASSPWNTTDFSFLGFASSCAHLSQDSPGCSPVMKKTEDQVSNCRGYQTHAPGSPRYQELEVLRAGQCWHCPEHVLLFPKVQSRKRAFAYTDGIADTWLVCYLPVHCLLRAVMTSLEFQV